MVCANKTMADGQALSKCRQVFQKGNNSSFHASGMVGGRPPGCDMPLSNPGHVSGTHLPSSSWQSKHRHNIKAAEPRPQCPCALVCYSPPKVNYSGASKDWLAWKLKSQVPVWANEKINRPINQCVARLHTPPLWCVVGLWQVNGLLSK